MKSFNLVFSLFLLFSWSCKSKINSNPIVGYVIKSTGIPVYSDYSFASNLSFTIPVNSKLKILSQSIADKARKNFTWIQVDYEGQKGYVSQSELDRWADPGISIFTILTYPETMLVRATSLRLRKTPSLTGEILTQLKNGEEVSVLESGSAYQIIDDINDIWVKVKTKDNQIGYCFQGFLISPVSVDDPSIKLDVALGYIVLSDNMNYYESPGKEKKAKVSFSKYDSNYVYSFKTGDIIPVSFKAKVNGITYYLINTKIHEEGGGGAILYSAYGWVSEKSVQHVLSLLDYTYKMVSNESPEYLAVYKYLKAKKKRIDFRNLELFWLEENSLAVLKANYSTSINKVLDSYSVLRFENNLQSVSLVSDLEQEKFGHSVRFFDFNKDGRNEIVFETFGRNGSSIDVYLVKDNGLKQIFTAYNGEVYEEDKTHYSEVEITESNITIKKKKDYDSKDFETEVYYYNEDLEKFTQLH
jgi:hypothetical protein